MLWLGIITVARPGADGGPFWSLQVAGGLQRLVGEKDRRVCHYPRTSAEGAYASEHRGQWRGICLPVMAEWVMYFEGSPL